jgi:hypothetical protein
MGFLKENKRNIITGGNHQRAFPGLFVHLIALLITLSFNSYSQDIEWNGMLAGWGTASYSEKMNGMLGARYVPALNITCPIKEKFSLDSEISFNAWASAIFWSDDSIVLNEKFKPYRIWLKFSGDRFEVRAGLQKINFGSALMLRPLMWFDRIDPRDPLQITDGVYGLLGRYYFLNNTNIWMWVLYGNDDPKGWEFAGTWRKWPELGGRVQIPVLTGEIAGTCHFRQADFRESGMYDTIAYEDPVNESRIGLDGKFDLLLGLWFEGAMTRQDLEKYGYQRYLNLGADYTFNIGKGLNIMTEFFTFSNSDKAFNRGNGTSFSAVSLTYPFSIICNLNAIVFYDWSNSDLYNFVNLSWQFDKWSFYLMGFWNPDRFQVYPGMEEANLFAGKGIQVMAVLNH